MQATIERASATDRTLKPCAHCGLPTYSTNSVERAFCCNGCMGAYAMIHEMGLEEFYAMRDDRVSFSLPAPSGRAQLLDNLDAAGVQVHAMSDGLCCVRLSVEGLHCAACSWLIERMQPTIPGLKSAQVRMSDHTVELVYDPAETAPAQVSRRYSRLGYVLTPWFANCDDQQAFVAQEHEHWIGIALAVFFAANAMWIGVALYAGEATGMSSSHETFLRWIGTMLAAFAVAFPGRTFLVTAWQAIRSRTPHIDIPIALSLAIGSIGMFIGAIRGVGQIYFDSLASLILLLRIGRYIQFRAQYRTGLWVSQLLRLNIAVATRIEPDGSFTKLPAHRLQVGERTLVQPGETFPADGIVIAGNSSGNPIVSSVDMSLVNGETTPLTIGLGDTIVGGTTNLSSPLEMRVTAVGAASRVGKLIEIVRNATAHRTPWMMAADRVSKWFVIAVVTMAALTFIGWSCIADMSTASEHTMALLTIACPCALALAAPLVLTVALGRAAKKRIWIRDGNCLEIMAKPGTMWLDKTGTITRGHISVLDWYGDLKWINFAASIEKQIPHPVAIAIQEFASQKTVGETVWMEAERVEHVYGRGIRGLVQGVEVCVGCQTWMTDNGIVIATEWLDRQRKMLSEGHSTVWVAIEQSIVGLFGMGDSLRYDTAATLRQLMAMGWQLGMISGDRQEIVDRIARELEESGVEWIAVHGNQTPEDKVAIIRQTKLLRSGPCVMVGDGVNDAAAMALADVGIAIRGGSEISLQAAPIYLANQQLASVVELVCASKNVVRGIRRCFAASLLYNSITMALAITGWIHPLIAAILMPISGVTVLLMAITAKTFKPNQTAQSERLDA